MEIQETMPIFRWENGVNTIMHSIPYGRFLKKAELNIHARRPEELYG